MNQIIEVLIAVLVPVVRSCAGWLENAMKDGKISNFEWKELGVTMFQVGLPAIALYIGLNEVGVDFSAIGAAAGGFLVSLFLRKKSEIKKISK